MSAVSLFREVVHLLFFVRPTEDAKGLLLPLLWQLQYSITWLHSVTRLVGKAFGLHVSFC